MKLDIPNEQYHSRPEVSRSDIHIILTESPYHYKNKDLFREEKKCFDIGGAFDTLTLQPELFNDKYAVMGKIDKRTKIGKEEHKNFIDKNINKTILSSEDFKLISNMKQSLLDDDEAKKILQNGEAEQSYFGELEGVNVRCRPDYYREDIGLIVDLKTSLRANPSYIAKSFANLDYDVQAVFYSDILKSLGYKVNKFRFIVVEKKAPYIVAHYDYDMPSLDNARHLYIQALRDYKYCKENNHWYKYGDFDRVNKKYNPVNTLTIPTWKYYE